MNHHPTNLCPECAHAPYCVITHNHSAVLSCSEFDELRHRAPEPILKITKREPEMATI
ncbi:hypothetical protein QRD02_00995 [Aequorivita sp. SDUM287046]|uniref:Uncharacterized protein n=1 Tax=Aequorivita aurantiaca TaxID=3053356 RepID=A0ABT8DGB0_9FLAO|nr:hypothetical protein [Aequorivita aurantiaca]MDN3722944.1 hypothetical protein [Aequorivita aurantiaca]